MTAMKKGASAACSGSDFASDKSGMYLFFIFLFYFYHQIFEEKMKYIVFTIMMKNFLLYLF